MARSLHLGRWFGIPVRVHWTFALLLGWIVWREIAAGSTFGQVVAWVGLTLTIFLCVLLHEYGHALTARRFGVGTRDITLLPFGGVARLQGMPKRPVEELLVAVGGPAVNVVIALGVGLLAAPIGWLGFPDPNAVATGPGFVSFVVFVNAFLVAFNLLPAFPMDGGRVLRALLAMRLTSLQATTIAARVGQLTALGLAAVGLIASPVLLVIALFVMLAAGAELRAARMQAARGGRAGPAPGPSPRRAPDRTVATAMQRAFLTLDPATRIHEAASRGLGGGQPILPVIEPGGRPVGLVRPVAILAALEVGAGDEPVTGILEPPVLTLGPDEPLSEAVRRIEFSGLGAALVVAEGRVVGILTAGPPGSVR